MCFQGSTENDLQVFGHQPKNFIKVKNRNFSQSKCFSNKLYTNSLSDKKLKFFLECLVKKKSNL